MTKEQINEHLVTKGGIAKWWLPDEVHFVESMPITGTGKIQKAELRKQYKDYKLRSLG